MTIDLSHIHQLDEIFKIFLECRKAMENENIIQWNDHYPAMSNILDDINNETLFSVNHKGKCLGVVTINSNESLEYKTIDWQDKNGKILVIHRLAVHPANQKQGIARMLMDFAEYFALNNNFTSIRLDAFSGNPRAIKFYESREYIKRGEVNFPGKLVPIPYTCFEKSIRQAINSLKE